MNTTPDEMNTSSLEDNEYDGWADCEKCGGLFENEPGCPLICGLCEGKDCECGQTMDCDECNERYEADPTNQKRSEDFFKDYLPRLHRDYPDAYEEMTERIVQSAKSLEDK